MSDVYTVLPDQVAVSRLPRVEKRLESSTVKEGTAAKADGSHGAEAFRKEATAAQTGIVREFVDFLLHNKKWWLAPIIVLLLLFGLLIVLAGTGAAPFIYTLF